MTFEEWISGMTVKSLMHSGIRKAWDAGQVVEREACALTLEKEIAYLRKLQGATAPYVGTALTQTAIEVVEKMAATIRARGEGEEGK